TASFNWTEAISATGIKIQQSLHGADTWSDSTTTVAIATNATSATVTGLSVGTAYDFRLVVTGGSNAGNSNTVEVTTDIPVTSITVTGAGDATTITTTAGTLQMSAVVLPADATNPSVNWTVTETTGAATTKATINAAGLLTAANNGTVRVIATSASNGAITGTKDITITNNPAPTPTTPTEDNSVEVIINDKVEKVATSVTTTVGDKTVTTVTLDDKKIEQKLEAEGNNSKVIIPVLNNSDVVVGQLNGATVKNMETKEAVLEIKTDNVTYTLPASEINIDDVSSQIGNQVELKDIKVSITIANPSQDTVKVIEDTANKGNFTLVVKPVEFEITCTSGGKTIDVSKFNGYVERTVAIPEGIDPSKITTGIVLNADGTFSHVPTTIIVVDGKYYAKINSLTNSTYSVIWNELSFKDIEGHWAKDVVNDLGSRLIISGVNKDTFSPDKDITRAEFASIVVKALGLMRPDTGKVVFSDVKNNDWYFDAVSIAYEYGIVKGYNGAFKPTDKITREEAMVMLSRAMELTKLENNLSDDMQNALLTKFNDGGQVSVWAKNSAAACLNSKIVVGTDNNILPSQNITRAETAVMIRRMLKTAGLI
ncbi:MAG: S-layer homology domain-containing protein, partial [Lutisporaceae bacterium]